MWNDEDETPPEVALEGSCGAYVRWDEVPDRSADELGELATTRCSFKPEADALQAACLSHNEGVTPSVGQVWFDCLDSGIYVLTELVGDDAFRVKPLDGNEDPFAIAPGKQLLESARYLYPSLSAYEDATRPRPYVRPRRSPMAD